MHERAFGVVGEMSAERRESGEEGAALRRESALCGKNVVPPAGIEPATPGLGNLCSIH